MSSLSAASPSNRQPHHILAIPLDVLKRCVAPYLCKGDQYQWLSTCKEWSSWLIETRTIYVCQAVPELSSNTLHFPNSVLWDTFKGSDRNRMLNALGCFPVDKEASSETGKSTTMRKIRLSIFNDTLSVDKSIVLDIVPYIYELRVEPCSKVFKNPNKLVIERWLMNSSTRIKEDERMIDAVSRHVAEKLEYKSSITANSFDDIRGVSELSIFQTIHCYFKFGVDLDMCLQSASFFSCINEIVVPAAKQIFLSNCPNFKLPSLTALLRTEYVQLTDISILDLRMLGRVKTLIIKRCTNVVNYPVPEFGKGQYWEFIEMDIANVSDFEALEKLTLNNCNNVKDGSMLGGISTLIIKAGYMEHYPVPNKGKGQHWTFRNVNITDVSAFATLEGLTLAYNNSLEDISMLGEVRFLTIHSCNQLFLNFSRPTGRLQEWTLNNMDLRHLTISFLSGFSGLLQLVLINCKIGTRVFNCTKNLKCYNCTIVSKCDGVDQQINLYGKNGKFQLVDRLTLLTAVDLWCSDEAIAMKLYGDIANWDVSRVKDMAGLFVDKKKFNNNINNWDVSNVVRMRALFSGAESFNQPLDSWNVSNVVDMFGIFQNAYNFNQPLDSWNVSKVSDMYGMFEDALSFNQPLDKWDATMRSWD